MQYYKKINKIINQDKCGLHLQEGFVAHALVASVVYMMKF